jgi:23S rRNA (guanosine2251-2'-O)-methyltransferase
MHRGSAPEKQTEMRNDWIPIAGRRPVEELHERGIVPEILLVARRMQSGKPDEALRRFQSAGWKIREVEPAQLQAAAAGLHHQGYVALIREFPYRRLDEIIAGIPQAAEEPFLVVLDQIQDVGNVGAILRTAECSGAAGAILPVHRAAGITAAVIRASAGAALHLPVARVVNIAGALERLKEADFRIIGADQEARRLLYEADLRGKIALVIGSEGRGLRPGVKRRCDDLISIPLRGRVASLNASVAAALCLYEILRHRLHI